MRLPATVLVVACAVAFAGCRPEPPPASGDARPARAFYFWRTRLALSPAERDALLARAPGATVSKTWYPALKALADTAYHREVLAECGWYAEWTKAR